MADKALVLYTGSNSTYNLEGIPHAINPVLESTFVREEAKAVTMAPLAIMPPLLSRASGGTSMRSMAWTNVAPGFKDKTRYTLYESPGSQISYIATNKDNIKRQYLLHNVLVKENNLRVKTAES